MKNDCPICDGRGWYEVPGHDPRCQGECDHCPIALQEQCERCLGTGEIESLGEEEVGG